MALGLTGAMNTPSKLAMAADVAAVLGKASGGDGEAFALLVNSHARTAFRLAYRLTGNERDAEDVVQESFIRAYRQLSRFEARSNFATWLHRIVVNCAMDSLRSRHVRRAERSGDRLVANAVAVSNARRRRDAAGPAAE